MTRPDIHNLSFGSCVKRVINGDGSAPAETMRDWSFLFEMLAAAVDEQDFDVRESILDSLYDVLEEAENGP